MSWLRTVLTQVDRIVEIQIVHTQINMAPLCVYH